MKPEDRTQKVMSAIDQLEREKRSLSQREFCKEFNISMHMILSRAEVRKRLADLKERFPQEKKARSIQKKPRKADPSPAPAPFSAGVSAKVTPPEVFERKVMARRGLAKAEELRKQQDAILKVFRYQPVRTAVQLHESMGRVNLDRDLIDRAIKDLIDAGTLKLISKSPYTYEFVGSTPKVIG